MTIAISLKVNDGLVFAADSASTLIARDPASGQTLVANVYNHANKVFNLRKALPIGAITWGSGSIGHESISTLVKDFRRRISSPQPDYPDWVIDRDNYTVEQVARLLRKFMYEEHYIAAFKDWEEKPGLGFVVGGYSSGSPMAEEYGIEIDQGDCPDPIPLRPLTDTGVTWSGEPEAITRLIFGIGTATPLVLRDTFGVPEDEVIPALEAMKAAMRISLVEPAMPIQDAIDLADFLADLTIKYSRFVPGAPTVGGAIEIAAITKHEGFKWVKRKYYYSRDVNPEEDE